MRFCSQAFKFEMCDPIMNMCSFQRRSIQNMMNSTMIHFFVIFSWILSSWKPASLRFSSNAGHSNSMCLIPFWICIPSRREKLKNKSICEFRSIFYLYEVLGKSWRRTSLVWELVGWVSKHKHQSSLHILKAKYEDIRIMHRKNMRQHFWVSGLSLG